MIEFSPVCVIRHFFLIPLRWRIRQILLHHIWATLQKACFVSHPRTFFARLTWVQTGFIISLRFFQIISVLLCFIFASGLKFQLLSEIHSHLRIL